MNASKTTILIGKYYCPMCLDYKEYSCPSIERCRHVKNFARAARKFVKEENKGKLRMLDMSNVEKEIKAIDKPTEDWVKLPKGFGEEPDFGAMLKNIRNRIAKLKRVNRNNKQKDQRKWI